MNDATHAPAKLTSVCVYCASSNAADPAYLQAAERFGAILAESGVRLVYGGGGVGLMGATARGAKPSVERRAAGKLVELCAV